LFIDGSPNVENFPVRSKTISADWPYPMEMASPPVDVGAERDDARAVDRRRGEEGEGSRGVDDLDEAVGACGGGRRERSDQASKHQRGNIEQPEEGSRMRSHSRRESS
jgi:hypothetical protein